MKNPEKVKVLYIAGWDRSGSTLLDNILGQVDGLFSAGELRYVWDRGLVENRICGCGAKFRECACWSEIFTQAFGGFEGVDTDSILGLRERCDRLRYMLQPLTAARRRIMEEYGGILKRLLLAIHSSTGAEVIVDSSKLPSHGYLLQSTPGIDVYVVHLTRDPRAVAFSWQRRKLVREVPGAYMRTMSPLECSLLWDATQVGSEALGRREPAKFMKVRYEDLMERPRQTVQAILDMLGGSTRTLPLLNDREVLLKPGHNVSGNPRRFETGLVALRADNEWKQKMTAWHKLLVTALTGPGLFRYGYRLVPNV